MSNENKKATAQRWLLLGAGILLGAVAVFSAWQIIRIQLESALQQDAFDQLRESAMITESDSAPAESDADSGERGDEAPEIPAVVQADYTKLFEAYPDMAAWITIPDTAVDYPVMHTPDRPNYYLRRDMNGKYGTYGVPYLNEACSLTDSDNLIVYGHSMHDGQMFGSLLDYDDPDYWKEHPTVQLHTPDGMKEYTVLGAFAIDVSSANPGYFDYNSFVNAADAAAYDEYVRQVKAHAFFDTGVSASFGQQLLTLSTCEYTLPDGRFVVVAVEAE